MSNPIPVGLIVTGMHRGGTSALTGAMVRLGLDPGRSDSLLGATEHNVDGHWEQEPLMLFNEEILVGLGGRWSGPPLIDLHALQELSVTGDWRARGRDLFEQAFADAIEVGRPWIWKDPRLALLLPFWEIVLGIDLPCVVSFRHPLEVARSLEHRNDFATCYGLALWERYQRSALALAARGDGVVIRYRELIEDPAGSVECLVALAAAVGLAPDDSEKLAAVKSLSSSLAHHRASDVELRSLSSPNLLALVDDVATSAPGRVWSGSIEETPGLQAAFDEHHRLSALADEVSQLHDGLAEMAERKDAERAELQRRKDRELAEAVAELDRLRTLLVAARTSASEAWDETYRMEAVAEDLEEARVALVVALEEALHERDGFKWEWLQAQKRPSARIRKRIRTIAVGEE